MITISYLLKIYANDKVSARRIEEENEKKRLEGTYNSHKSKGNNDDGCVQMDASKRTERNRATNTREQRAKKLALVLELLLAITK